MDGTVERQSSTSGAAAGRVVACGGAPEAAAGTCGRRERGPTSDEGTNATGGQLSERIAENAHRLTATERRIAEVLVGEPQAVAFGTVAAVARRAGTSAPSVVRLGAKLGYQGFVGLQAQVRHELTVQLGPPRRHVRRPPTDLLEEVVRQELDNVDRTLRQVDSARFERTVGLLSDLAHPVWVMGSEVSHPVGSCLVFQLGQLRQGVSLLGGSEVAVRRALAGVAAEDALVVMDVHRYERWLVDALTWVAAERHPRVVALTDSPLSPLVGEATESFFVAGEGIGPFDSMTGSLALVNALAVGVAARLADTAAGRLDTIEAAWTAGESLVGAPGCAAPPEPEATTLATGPTGRACVPAADPAVPAAAFELRPAAGK